MKHTFKKKKFNLYFVDFPYCWKFGNVTTAIKVRPVLFFGGPKVVAQLRLRPYIMNDHEEIGVYSFSLYCIVHMVRGHQLLCAFAPCRLIIVTSDKMNSWREFWQAFDRVVVLARTSNAKQLLVE